MRRVNTASTRQVAAVLALGAAIAGCSRPENQTSDSAGGNVATQTAGPAATADTGVSNAATPVAGGTAQITPTDAKSVEHATEYRLTETNFRQFIAASDGLAALRGCDPAVRDLFDKQVNDAGTTTATKTMKAGRKRLEENPAVSRAITSTGMSVKDYFVAAIAVAQAERFIGNPKSAPPTPALPTNAEFLKAHAGELQALRTLEKNK